MNPLHASLPNRSGDWQIPMNRPMVFIELSVEDSWRRVARHDLYSAWEADLALWEDRFTPRLRICSPAGWHSLPVPAPQSR